MRRSALALAAAPAALLGIGIAACDTVPNTPQATCAANDPDGPGGPYGSTRVEGGLHPAGGAGAICGYADGGYGPLQYCIRYSDELKVVC